MSEVNKYFLKEKNRLIRKLGRNALSNHQLNEICKDMPKYRGCFMQDELKEYKNGYYILNTDTKKNTGIHWISVYTTPKTAYIFDSYGRDTHKITPILKKTIEASGRKIIESDKDQDQKGYSQLCGHLCVSWLLCCQKFGIKKTINNI